MTATKKVKKIHAVIGLTKKPDGEVTPLLNGSLKGLTNNANLFPKPPVDLPAYAAAIGVYEDAIPVALDGSKTAVAHKNKLRDTAVKMYTELAHYVEANCNEEMATFLLSGFQAASTTRTPAQALAQPTIASVVPGPVTGQQKVKINAVPKALSYDLHYAPVPAGGGTPASWTEQTVTSTKAIVIGNLTPGTTYTFQVRGLGRLGYTDWSDPVNRMAT